MTKREEFIEQSLKLIHQKGFKATTIRDIAECMDCDVANVYNYIDSKQGLLESHLFAINKEFHDNVDQIIKSNYPPVDKIKKLVALYVDMTVTRPLEAALLVNEWRNLKEPKLSEFIKGRESFERKVKKIIIEGINDGAFRQMNPELATYSMLSSVRWLFNKYAGKKIKVNKIEVEREIVEFVLKGLNKEKRLR